MSNLKQWTQLWTRLNAKQRAIAGGGALMALLVVGLLVRSMSSPEMKPLMTGLESDDSQALSQQLAAKNIQYKMAPDGKEIDVPVEKLDEARMIVASQGTTHGRMGFELFDKTSWGQTEFDERVNYQRALEGELERTIGTLNGVKSVRVHLVLPHSSVFLDSERAAKASVTLRLKHGVMSDQQLQAIGRLVSGAVDSLAPQDVAIIDADNNLPLNHHADSPEGRELEAHLTKSLLDTLGPVVGVDNLRASVNVEYELQSSEENDDEYDPSVSALLTTQKSAEQAGQGIQAGGVAGTSSNIPPPGAGQPGSAPDALQALAAQVGPPQTSTSENSTYGVNKIERHTIEPAGGVRRITAAIVVNDASNKKLVGGKLVGDTFKRSEAELAELRALASAVIGIDPRRGDVVTVQNLTFAAFEDADAPVPFSVRAQQTITQFSAPLRYASMLLLVVLAWVLMGRPIQKTLANSLREGNSNEFAALKGDLTLASPSPEDSLTSQLEPDVSSIGLKQQLSQMVQSEPAAMARTVQSWLQES